MNISNFVRTIPLGEKISSAWFTFLLILMPLVCHGEHNEITYFVSWVWIVRYTCMMSLLDFGMKQVIPSFHNVIGQMIVFCGISRDIV